MRLFFGSLLALFPLSLAFAERGPEHYQGPQEAPFDTSAKACGACHKEIYAQWQGSRHAIAWTSDIYQAWAKTKKDPVKSCHRCHAPQSVIPVAPKRPPLRDRAREEGVACASCHVFGGKVHGPTGVETDAHPTVKSALFAPGNVALCQSCHRVAPKPVLTIGKDFEKYVKKHKDASCRGCHMPAKEGFAAFDRESGKPVGKKRQVNHHGFAGRTDPKMIAKAFAFHRESKDGKWSLRLENKAGHRLPGIQLRSYAVKFEVLDAAGKVLATRDATISAKREETLHELASLTVELDPPAGAQKARVRVHHWFQKLKDGKRQDLGLVFEAEL